MIPTKEKDLSMNRSQTFNLADNLDMSKVIEENTMSMSRQRSNSMNEAVEKLDIAELKAKTPVSDNKRSGTMVEALSIKDLNFEKFYRTNITEIFLCVMGHENRIFSHIDYKIQCVVGNFSPFIIYKRYSEFKAIHKAIRIRFENVVWPDMPSKFQILNKVERRTQAFDKIIKKIIEVVRLHASVKKSLLGLLYAFLFDEDNKKRLIQEELQLLNKKNGNPVTIPSTPTSSALKLSAQGDDDDDDDADMQARFEQRLKTLDFRDADNSKCEELDLSTTDNPLHTIYRSSTALNASVSDVSALIKDKEKSYSEVPETFKSNVMDRRKIGGSVLQPTKSNTGNNGSLLITADLSPAARAQMIRSQLSLEEDAENRLLHADIVKHIDNINFSEEEEEEDEVTDGLPISLDSEKGKKNAKEPSKLSQKEILNFAGDIWIKFQSEDNWKKYYGRINDCFLNLHQSMVDNSIAVMIPCYMIKVSYIKGPLNYIVISHFYDNDSLQLSIEPNTTKDEQKPQHDKFLRVWYAQLKIASEKQVSLDFEGIKYKPIGKVQVHLCESGNIKGLPLNSILYVKIRHTPFKLTSKKCLFGAVISWNQKFHLPLCDHFFNIYFDIYCLYNDGWIKEHQKEELVCSGSLLVADLISVHDYSILKIKLPMEYSEAKKKSIEKLLASNKSSGEALQIPEPFIKLKIKNLSSFKTFFSSPPENYIEGVKFDPEVYVKYNLRVALHRIKTLFAIIAIKMRELNGLFYFKYPLFSLIMMIVILYMIITFDMNFIVNDLLVFFALLTIYQYPPVYKRITDWLDEYIFTPANLNRNFREPLVETVKQSNRKMLADMNRFKQKIKDPDSLMTTLKKIKNGLASMTMVMMELANFIEKFKNLVCWVDSTRTVYFFMATIFVFCALNAFTLRLLIFLGTLNTFLKGMSHYKMLYLKNEEVAQRTMTFIIKRFFPDSVSYFIEPTNLWPPTGVNFNTFQKKIIEQMRYRLNLCLPENALVTYPNIESFVSAIATCSVSLKFHVEIGEEMQLDAVNQTKPPKFSGKAVLNYIWNIPSDYFRLLHPTNNYYSETGDPKTSFALPSANTKGSFALPSPNMKGSFSGSTNDLSPKPHTAKKND